MYKGVARRSLLKARLVRAVSATIVLMAACSAGAAANPKLMALSTAAFVENKGQWDKDIRFGLASGGMNIRLTDSKILFTALQHDGAGKDEKSSTVTFSASLEGARCATLEAMDPTGAKMNFCQGSDKSKWQIGVPTYKVIVYKGIYDKMDLYISTRPGGLKYEFVCQGGAKTCDIVMRYEGIEGLSIDGAGALHVKTGLGDIVDAAPVVRQRGKAGDQEIPSRYRLIDGKSYGFTIAGPYDPSRPLVIDPSIEWASLSLGSGGAIFCERRSGQPGGNRPPAQPSRTAGHPPSPRLRRTGGPAVAQALAAEKHAPGLLILSVVVAALLLPTGGVRKAGLLRQQF